MNSANETYEDFPVVGRMESEQGQRGDKRGFQNSVYPNDSITTCSGFINDIRTHEKDGETLYFVRVGLIQGSRKNEQDDWEGDITNCDLLVGATLRKWAEAMKGFKDHLAGVRVNFTIRNLKFSAGLYEGKPVLNSRGVLESITIGRLDR